MEINKGIKIIEDNFTRTYQCVCPTCKSKFEFNHTSSCIIEKKNEVTINCPLCATRIFLAQGIEEEFQNVVEVTKKNKPKTKLLESKNAQTTKKKDTIKDTVNESQTA